MAVKQTIRVAFWGFFWGYMAAFLLCLGLFEVGLGCPWPGWDGLLDMTRYVFLSQAQYFFLFIGTIVALVRANNANVDEEAMNEERLESWEETMESGWEDRPE